MSKLLNRLIPVSRNRLQHTGMFSDVVIMRGGKAPERIENIYGKNAYRYISDKRNQNQNHTDVYGLLPWPLRTRLPEV